jgi:long-chain acyl-CoA synthetase
VSIAWVHDLPRLAPVPEDRIALEFKGQKVSYGELRQNIRRWAHFLRERGVEPGDRVVICMPNCPEFVYSYLGASLAGAVVVPLNLMLTPEEIMFVLRDCTPRVVLVHPAVAARMSITPPPGAEALLRALVVTGDEVLARIAALSPDGPLPGDAPPADARPLPSYPRFAGKTPRPAIVAGDTPCAILYTSGTTGRPKGAVLSHRNFLANVRQMDDASDLGPDERFLCVLPMFHSFGWTVCVLFALYLGARITILDAFRPRDTLRALAEDRVSVFCGVPAMFAVLAQSAAEPQPMPHLKLTVSGGAPLPEPVIRAFEAKFGAVLYEGYGLSEASPVVCLNPLYGVRKVGSVGIPLPGIQVRVVGEGMADLPVGEIGEIAVRGDNVMLGYYNMPEETRAALVDGWLLTGDLGRLDEEGYVYVVDRKKDLVIVSGFNVYPREVEDTIMAHPLVAEAAVIGVPDPVKGEMVKAFVVPREGASLDRADLLNFLRPRLARYKLPQIIEFTDTLPRTPSGKVLKRALR